MKSYLFIMVLLIVLAIPLFASPAEHNSAANSLRISINNREEVVREYISTISYEILAIKPAEIKQSWLPTRYNNGRLYAKADINTRFRNNNITINKGRHRMQSGFN